MASETKTCRKCSSPFEVEFEAGNAFSEMGARMARFCLACLPSVTADSEQARIAEEAAEREARWAKICPAEYRDTDLTHDGLAPEFVTAAKEWRPGPRRGLGFISDSGRGKTRLLYVALHTAFSAGLWTHATSHLTFRKVAIDASSAEGDNRYAARAKLDMMARVDVLLFDDIGKPASTECVDSEFEDLIERRTSQRKPILWSSNGAGEWLIRRFGEDRGKPIVRRLAEFSLCPEVKEPAPTTNNSNPATP